VFFLLIHRGMFQKPLNYEEAYVNIAEKRERRNKK